MGGYRTEMVNVWAEPLLGPTPPAAMIDSLLYLPDGSAGHVPRPGLLFVPGWARYPYDRLARTLGPALAGAGVAVLCLGIRRRGGEGQIAMGSPDTDLRDIKLGLDALGHHGVATTVLVGQDVGATSCLRYGASSGDNRVAGVALVDPIDELDGWLEARVGREQVSAWRRLAAQATYEMKSDLVRIDVDVPRTGQPPLWIHQSAAAFLAWWSPNPRMRLVRLAEEVASPVAAFGCDRPALEPFFGTMTTGEVTGGCESQEMADAVAAWALDVLPRPGRPATFELVEATTAGGEPLVGYLVGPASGGRSDAAVLVVHGLTTGPFSPMVKQFFPHYVDHGFTTLAIETRRSGVRCVAESDPDDDIADIDAFVELLLGRGFDRVVLVGASLGSQALSRYVGRRHHPAVVAAVHLAPTADMPASAEANIGPSEYARLVEEASQAVERGDGRRHLLVYDLTEQGPSRFHAYRRTFWRAGSWLAWWGPTADTVHARLIRDVDVPILLVCGTADDYNDQARMDLLEAAAVAAPYVEQRWFGADHGLRGAEGQATAAVVDWLEAGGLVERRPSPPSKTLAPVSPSTGASHLYPPPPGPEAGGS